MKKIYKIVLIHCITDLINAGQAKYNALKFEVFFLNTFII